MRIKNHYARSAAIIAIVAAACTDPKQTLLDAPISTIIDTSAASSAAGADALRIGALSRLRQITAGSGAGDSPWMFAGLITDEWKSSDTFSQRNETDQRQVQDNNANWTPIVRDLYRARTSAREAINALVTYLPNPPANLAQMYMVMATAELYIAEWICNGTPIAETANPPQATNADVYAIAFAHADSAVALSAPPSFAGAKAADTAFALSVRNAAAVVKGRILIEQGKFPEAAAAVAAVPTGFQLLATFSLTSGDNQIWSLSNSAKRWTVGDSFDVTGILKNALPFASAKDPRIPISGTTLGTSPVGRGFDNSTNLVVTTLWARSDPAPIWSGLDARLIEAEAKLKANDIAGMMTILNALRGTSQTLGPLKVPAMAALAIPATQDAAVSLFFREKAFWQFGRGMRLGDMRRLIRQYNRTQDQVFPVGKFHKAGGNSYGTDVNLPVTDNEKTNPNFTGCIDRNA
jgi:hypothetical protein